MPMNRFIVDDVMFRDISRLMSITQRTKQSPSLYSNTFQRIAKTMISTINVDVIPMRYTRSYWVVAGKKSHLVLAGTNERAYEEGIFLLVHHMLSLLSETVSVDLFSPFDTDDWRTNEQFAWHRLLMQLMVYGTSPFANRIA